MAFKNKKNHGRNFNFYQKVEVDWSQFGAPDGFTVTDGYGADLVINFPTSSIMFINEETTSTSVVEYSFNGIHVHGELDPTLPSKGLIFDNRSVSLIWFRVKAGSTGPITVRVDAWGS